MMAERLQTDNGPIATGEASVDISRVDAARQRIDADLLERFNLPGSRRDIPFGAAMKLLETGEGSLKLAAGDLGMVPEEIAASTKRVGRKDLHFTQDQVLALNGHEFIRTADEQELAHDLHISAHKVIELAKMHHLVPIVRHPHVGNPKADEPIFYAGFFDLDQQQIIREQGLYLPVNEGFVPVAQVMARLGLTQKGFTKLEKYMEFGITVHSNASTGEYERYVPSETIEEIGLCLEAIKNNTVRPVPSFSIRDLVKPSLAKQI